MPGPATATSGYAPSTGSGSVSTRDARCVRRGGGRTSAPRRRHQSRRGGGRTSVAVCFYVFAEAEPPKLLLTCIPCGFRKNSVFSENRPPPLLVRSNMKLPVVVKTDRIAFGFV